MSDVLEIVPHGRVLRLILNRPEKRNALNAELCRELVHALESADRDDSVRAIVLSGRGEAFCAGMDLGELGSTDTPELADLHDRLFTIGVRLGKPLIAAVEGSALGGGTGLVANCHIVIAGEGAKFGLTEIRLGLWPFLIYRAVALAVGERVTLNLALTGRILSANEARTFGLVHELASRAEEPAMATAEQIAAFSSTAVRTGLRFVHETRDMSWQAAGLAARAARAEAFASPEFQAGIRDFLEKRRKKEPVP